MCVGSCGQQGQPPFLPELCGRQGCPRPPSLPVLIHIHKVHQHFKDFLDILNSEEKRGCHLDMAAFVEIEPREASVHTEH